MGEAERGDSRAPAPGRFFCAKGHETRPSFAEEAAIPEHVGLPALRLAGRPRPRRPARAPQTEPYKTHLAYVRERRSDDDGEAILAEALAKLRGDS